MSMLAEQRRRQKYSVDPRGLNWSKDENKFGQRMLERMGWKKGKGLGAKEDGNTEHVKVSFKSDSRGVGSSKSHADSWVAHQDDFNALLSTLNADHGDQGSDTEKVQSLEETSKTMKGRVHYGKFARGKDLSMYRSHDLDSIFGKRKSKSEPNTPSNVSEANSDAESTKSNEERGTNNLEKSFGVITMTSSTNLQDYFAQKMAELKREHPNSRFNQFPSTNQTGQSGLQSEDDDDSNTTRGFGFSSIDHSVNGGKLESATEKEENDVDCGKTDSTCSKKKKSKRKSRKDNSDIEDGERSGESVRSKKCKKKHKSAESRKSSKKKEEIKDSGSVDGTCKDEKPIDKEKPKKKPKKDKKRSHEDEHKEVPDVDSKTDLESMEKDKHKNISKKDKKKALSGVESKSYVEDKHECKSKKNKEKSCIKESNAEVVISEHSKPSKGQNTTVDEEKKSKKRKKRNQDEMSLKEDVPIESVPKKKKKDKHEDGEKSALTKSTEEEKIAEPEPGIPDARPPPQGEPSNKCKEIVGKTDDLKNLSNKDLGVRDKLAAAFPGSNVDVINGYAGGVSLRTTKFKNKKNKKKK